MSFEAPVGIDDPWHACRPRSDLHEAVWWAVREEAIVTAFPQLDVHIGGALHERHVLLPRAS